jgi:hypothetical protein
MPPVPVPRSTPLRQVRGQDIASPSVRRSSRIAFAVAWVAYVLAAVYAWRKVLGVPDGRGDINGLLIATVAGALGLGLLGSWLQEHERR